MGPDWLRWTVALLLGVICVSCLARLATARHHPTVAPRPHEDLAQVLMGVGMIAMLVSWLGTGPRAALLLVFAVTAAGFTGLLVRGRPGDTGTAGRDTWESVHHLVASLAMVYMAVAMPGRAGDLPAVRPLAAAFGMYFLLYAGWAGLRMVAASTVSMGGGVGALLRRPRIVDGCRAAMGLGMAYALLM